ncbi:hypothetical protein B6U91_01825 [Candidatus Pacearchaeota archaeon ex4484_71]|nr:MAG: hypothetical protein B6U91_01825 [Candidatus Pacearchaeota archaeon ex4484_71]
MDKKLNVWAFAVLAGIVVVLMIGAIGSSMTGNGIFDWMKKSTATQTTHEQTYNGLLAEKYLEAGMSSEDLKNYEVKYDENGDMVYEFGKGALIMGGNYERQEEGNGIVELVSKSDGEGVMLLPCGDRGEGCVISSCCGNLKCCGSQTEYPTCMNSCSSGTYELHTRSWD